MQEQTKDKPNVLVICVDHWPGGMIGALGHSTILTPTLDQLISNGVAYTNAYATTPSCIPARRELMTGAFSPTHGDRVFNETLPMPKLPTMAETFREAGYQAYAVGKLHVYPQRDRIGFNDVLLNEEGRHHLGLMKDDYEIFLNEQGYAGQELTHGISNNEYYTRPWHLPEYCHSANWTAREMCKCIVRRDPTKPSLWFMSFDDPHPPLAPLAEYIEMYRDLDIDMPYIGDWAENTDDWPHAIRARSLGRSSYSEAAIRLARQAFYAQCTHIDHQIRVVIGTLREEGLLDNTAILFTSDHGDMLGNHGLYAKAVFYQNSTNIPMVLAPPADRKELGQNRLDDRLAAHADILPTVLELCDIPTPGSVEGLSLVSDQRREFIYGEHWEDAHATRMIHDGRHKLIYYAVGNRTQLFDLQEDQYEMQDAAGDPRYADVRERLTDLLVRQLYGSDLKWLDGEELVGLPETEWAPHPQPSRRFGNQRGWRFT